MKPNLALIIITLLCISCTKNDNIYKETKIEIDPNLYLTKEFAVPIIDSKITVVTNGNDTLAVTDMPVTIEVPKEATIDSRSGSSININYVDYKELPKFEKGSLITSQTGIFLFEDTEKADYDYNDLIISYSLNIKNIGIYKYYTVYIKPIALGSNKKLAFGFTDYNNQTQYLSKNVREDWFLGKEGFINSVKETSFQIVIENGNTNEEKADFEIIRKLPYQSYKGGGYIKYDSKIANFLVFHTSGLKYFIEDEAGKKYYVAARDLNINGSLPYGLYIPISSIECYPYERQNIDKAFPYFTSWINNKGYLSWYTFPSTNDSYVLTNENYFYLPQAVIF